MIESLLSKLKLDRLNFNNIKIILEVGSRDGNQAIELSKAFPNARILAIEGNPDTIDLLKNNISPYPNIDCVESIISDYDGIATFYKIDREKTITPHADGNPGASSLYVADPAYPHEKYAQVPIEVQCETLDSICNKYQLGSIDLIWIDLQGAEIKALRGLKERLKEVQYIWVEITHIPLYVNQPLFPEFDAFMVENGFEILTPVHPKAYFEDALYRRKNLKEMPKDAISLMQPWGGLGDNLQFSTLPELFALSNKSFFISNQNISRNQEIEDLVWGSNPFVHGISTQEPNAGSVLPPLDGHEPSYIKRIEQAHGLKATNKAPKLHIFPNVIKNLQGKTLIDLSAAGLGGGDEKNIRKAISKLFPEYLLTRLVSRFNFDKSNCMQISFVNFQPNKNITIDGIEEIKCHSLDEYCSILYSIDNLITVHSGAHSLAVSIRDLQGAKLKDIFCLVPRNQYERGLFIYEDVKYVLT
jgi:FkbM family methyltransferase